MDGYKLISLNSCHDFNAHVKCKMIEDYDLGLTINDRNMIPFLYDVRSQKNEISGKIIQVSTRQSLRLSCTPWLQTRVKIDQKKKGYKYFEFQLQIVVCLVVFGMDSTDPNVVRVNIFLLRMEHLS